MLEGSSPRPIDPAQITVSRIARSRRNGVVASAEERRERRDVPVPAGAANSWPSIFVVSRRTRQPLATAATAAAVVEEEQEAEEGATQNGAVAGYKPGGEWLITSELRGRR